MQSFTEHNCLFILFFAAADCIHNLSLPERCVLCHLQLTLPFARPAPLQLPNSSSLSVSSTSGREKQAADAWKQKVNWNAIYSGSDRDPGGVRCKIPHSLASPDHTKKSPQVRSSATYSACMPSADIFRPGIKSISRYHRHAAAYLPLLIFSNLRAIMLVLCFVIVIHAARLRTLH